MAGSNWKTEINGNWTTAADWSPSGVPTAATAVNITTFGGTLFTISVSSADVASTLTLNSADATIAINSGGSLTVGSTLALTTGTLQLNGNGTVANSTGTGVVLSAPTISITNGTLAESGGTLTIGAGTTISHASGAGADLTGGGAATDKIINNGTILSSAGGGLGGAVLTIDPGIFVNAGSITTTSGKTDIIDIEAASITNSNTISVLKGNVVEIGELGNTTAWSNTGTVTVAAGAEIDLGINFTTTISSGAGSLGTLKATRSGAISASGIPSSGIVSIDGTVTNTSGTIDLTVTTGNLTWGELQVTGEIIGGTIKGFDTVPTIFAGGELNGVTYDGLIDLSYAPQSGTGAGSALPNTLEIANGLTLKNAAGTANGVLNDTGTAANGAKLLFDDTQTFNNATINIGNANTSSIIQQDVAGTGGTLTLGSGVTITESVAGTSSDIGAAGGPGSGDTIVSLASINISAGSMTIDPDIFINQGGISATGGGGVHISGSSFTNSGTISIGASSTGTIGANSWSNLGTITVGSGATLHLGGNFSGTGIGSLTNTGGTIAIDGTLTNTGTLTVGAATSFGKLFIDGTVSGGTIQDTGMAPTTTFYGASLNGVTYDGTIDLSIAPPGHSFGYMSVSGGLTLHNSAGSGPGTLSITGSLGTLASSSVSFVGTQTFDNATVYLGSASSTGPARIEIDDNTGGGATLTLGTNLTIVQQGQYAELTSNKTISGPPTTQSIINNGTITAGVAAGDFLVKNPNTGSLVFTNQGTINVSNGDLFDIESASFGNSAGATVTIASGSTVTIGSSTTGSNAGTISGNGTLSGALANTGTIEALSGTLTVTGGVTGTGIVDVGAAATLRLSGAVSGGTADFSTGSGTLALVAPGSFSGALGSVAAGDVIDLVNIAANSIAISSGSLVVSEGASQVASFSLAGTTGTFQYALTSDGSGGTDILVEAGLVAPVTNVPGAQTTVAGTADAITGISVSDTTPGLTFTVTVSDGTGILAATGTGVSNSGTNDVTIIGSQSQVNTDLATLTYTQAVGSVVADTITVATSVGPGASSSGTIGVTVIEPPVTTVPGAQTDIAGTADAVTGISVADANSGLTFTVTVSDGTGVLAATGTGVSNSGTNDLTITGSQSQVNADLATLTYTSAVGSVVADTITVASSNGFSSSSGTIGVTVIEPPVTNVPGAQTAVAGTADSITGISVADANSGLTFTVTVSDGTGVLAATGTGVSNSGTNDLTIIGSQSQVNSDLATLTYTQAVGSVVADTITVATSNGSSSSSGTIGVTVIEPPVTTVPGAQTEIAGMADAITGISVADANSGLTFTVTVSDGTGVLAATGTGVSNSGTNDLTITGSQSQVNADLATLTYTSAVGSVVADTITVATSNGHTSSSGTIGVTVIEPPVTSVPGAQTEIAGTADAITGISIADANSGLTFTVTVSDGTGVLAATGTGVSNSGTNDLTFIGSLSQVNSDLATLTYTQAVGSVVADTITVATSNGHSSSSGTIGVTVIEPPVTTVPGTQTEIAGTADAITGISVADANSGLTFTVTVSDGTGILAATGTGVSNSGTTDLTITGSLSQVNSDLATLTYTSAIGSVVSDTITVATSNGHSSNTQTIAVTVEEPPVTSVPGSQTVTAGTADAITGISVSDAASGLTYTVTVSDGTGVLAATGTGVSNSGTNDLTITGSQSQVNADLATLTYTGASAGTDTITVATSDSQGVSGTAEHIGVTISAVNVPVTTVPGAQTAIAGTADAISGISVSDATSGLTYTVTVSDGTGILAATGTGVSNSGTTALTITGSQSQVNADLATLTYTQATGSVISDTITVGDTDSQGASASQQTIAVTVEQAPVTSVPGGQTAVGGSATSIGEISVSDAASGLTYTVTVSDGTGVLAATGAGVSNSGTNDITITGSQSQVNADLATLTYTAATGSVISDTITVATVDSQGLSSPTQTIGVVVEQTPVTSVPGAQTAIAGTADAISGISVSDVVSGLNFTVTVSDGTGILSATGTGVTNSGTNDLTITGSQSQVNADLATLTYTQATGSVVSDTITVATLDSQGLSSSGTIGVTVIEPPVTTVPGAQTEIAGTADAITGISVADANAGLTFTVTVSDGTGVLSATGTGVSNSGTNDLTIIGSQSQVNSDLATLTYTSAVGSVVADTITVATSNGHSTSTGTIGVTVIEPPVTSVPGAQAAVAGTADAISGISVADATSGLTFTVTVSDGTGVLAATGTGVSNSGTNDLTIIGSQSQVNADLATLTYTSAVGSVVSDTITVASSNGYTSSSGTIGVTVIEPPVTNVPGAQTAVAGTADAITGISVADANSGLTFTVTVSDGTGVLAATGTGVSNSGTNDLTIIGSQSQVNADLATLIYTSAVGSVVSDTITVATSNGHSSSSGTIGVTVIEPPVTNVPGAQTEIAGTADAISGISVADANSGLTFTVTVSDGTGVLAATGTGVSNSGTNDLTIIGSQSQVNADLATLTYTSAIGSVVSDTITVATSNGFSSSSGTIGVTVIEPPVTTVPGTQMAVAGTADAITGISVADANAGLTFTVTVSDGTGVLAATGAGVSGSGTNDLTITGSQSQVNADLATLTYTGATGTATSDTISIATSNGHSSNTQTIAVDVDQPPVTTVPGSQTVTAGTTDAISGISIADSDAASADKTFTVTVSDMTGDLSATGSGISGSGTTDLTITGSLSQVDADLSTLTYQAATGSVSSDTITIATSDGRGGSSTATIAVHVNQAPVETLPGSQTVTAGTAKAITGISVTDSNPAAEGGTFTVSVTDFSGSLSATGTGVGGTDTSHLTITGTLAQINADLATLTYTGVAGSTSDTITVVTTDDLGISSSSNNDTIGVTINQPLTPPQTIGPRSATVISREATTIAGISVADPALGSGGLVTVTVSDNTGLLTAAASGGGDTVTGSGTRKLVITGTLAEVNADLAALTYMGTWTNGAASISDTITVKTQDADGQSHKNIAVTVDAIPPTTTVPGAETVIALQTTHITGIRVADGDAMNNNDTMTVTISDQSGLLSATASGAGDTVTGAGTKRLVITGSLAEVNADLTTLTYTGASTGASATVGDTIKVDTSNGLGGSDSHTIVVTVDQTPPMLTAPSTLTVTKGVSTPLTGTEAILASDVDTAAGTADTFTLTLTDIHGLLYGTQPGGGTITGSGTKDLVITGTLAQVDAHLAALAYVGEAVGTDVITASLSNGIGGSASAAIHVTVGAAAMGMVQAMASFGASNSGTTGGFTPTSQMTDSVVAANPLH